MNLISASIALALVTCGPAATPPPREVDGFVVAHVPAGTGQRVGEFAFEWEDVTFRSQVWERGPDATGAYAVDLTVKVLRGARLTDLAATREFLAGYHEQDPSTWEAYEHLGQPGHRRPDAVFWWACPGVAVEVTLDGTRFAESDLTATALGVRPEPGGQKGCQGSGGR